MMSVGFIVGGPLMLACADTALEGTMVSRPEATNSFEFIRMAALRTAQLMQGCVPRVPVGHKFTITAQLEVAGGHVLKLPAALPTTGAADRQGDTAS